jgi:hypothetical protein
VEGVGLVLVDTPGRRQLLPELHILLAQLLHLLHHGCHLHLEASPQGRQLSRHERNGSMVTTHRRWATPLRARGPTASASPSARQRARTEVNRTSTW